ncbi:MAG: hypothetical protein HC837_11350 [Chloroflexaceae bacterium]|nr:hypothetical protein [Chloroflexaceae bacterium]
MRAPGQADLRQTADSLIATLDTQQYYLGRSVIAITAEGDWPLHALLALCNAHLLSAIYQALTQEQGRLLAQVKVNKVQLLPIPPLTLSTPGEQRAALLATFQAQYDAAMLSGMAAPAATATWRDWADYWQPLLAWPCPNGAALPTDVLYDRLCFLATRMLALEQARQAEQARFLGWLAQTSGSTIANWRRKTVLARYWQHPWSTIAQVLSSNRRHMAAVQGRTTSAAHTALQQLSATVEQHWQASAQRSWQLLAQLHATDRLIDLLVYQLYGLEPSAIDLVEHDRQQRYVYPPDR